MKSVLISIQPKWCELIASGKKTIEVRKTVPKLEAPFKCYIYETKGFSSYFIEENNIRNKGCLSKARVGGKVIGEFVCDIVEEFHEWQLSPGGKFREFEQKDLDNFLQASCLSYEEVCAYRENLPYYKPLYGWHISDLKIYDKPKELGEFRIYCENKNCLKCKRSERKSYSFECSQLDSPPQSWCYVEDL